MPPIHARKSKSNAIIFADERPEHPEADPALQPGGAMIGRRSFLASGGLWVIAQLALFAVIVALVLWGPGLGDPPGAVRAVGALVLVSGLAELGAGLAYLGRNLTPYPEPTEGSTLVEAGIYRLVRHPIYGGVVLTFAGLGLAAGALVAAAVALALIPFFLAKSAHEERRLSARHPEYEAYRRRVPKRLFPGLL